MLVFDLKNQCQFSSLCVFSLKQPIFYLASATFTAKKELDKPSTSKMMSAHVDEFKKYFFIKCPVSSLRNVPILGFRKSSY